MSTSTARVDAPLAALAGAVGSDPGVASFVEREGVDELTLRGPEALRPFVAAALAQAGTVLVVTATQREGEDLVVELGDLIGSDSVAFYPAWETLPHERLSPRSDTVGRRLAVLRRLVHADPMPLDVIVAPVRSLLQPQVKGLADLAPVSVSTGDDHGLEHLVRDLAAAAYVRVDLVERRGEFAVRGGIVDVFPPTEEHPLRVEFWGDTVEEIRRFAVADQRSLDAVDDLWAPPCRELLLTDEVRARAAELAREHPSLSDLFSKLAEGHAVEGMESLAPVLVGDMESLVSLLPGPGSVLICDPERVRARAHDLVATSDEFLQASWAAAASGAEAPIDLGPAAFHTLDAAHDETRGLGHAWLGLSPFGLDDDSSEARYRGHADIPRRDGGGAGRRPRLAGRGSQGRHRGARPRTGAAHGRVAGRARHPGITRT